MKLRKLLRVFVQDTQGTRVLANICKVQTSCFVMVYAEIGLPFILTFLFEKPSFQNGKVVKYQTEQEKDQL